MTRRDIDPWALYDAFPNSGSIDIDGLAHLLATDDRAAVADALTKLEHLALVRQSLVHDGKFRSNYGASSLTIAAEILTADLAVQVCLLRQLTLRICQLDRDSESADTTGVEIVTGHDAILGAITAAVASATNRVDTVLAYVPDDPDITEALRDDQLIYRGEVSGRMIYPEAAILSRGIFDYARQMSAFDVSIRTVPLPPARLLLIDDRLAILDGRIPPGDAKAVLVRVPAVFSCLNAFFENLWQDARPLATESATTSTPSSRGITILRLLSTGATEAVIAERLALDPRTVRRDISDLYKIAGVRSRFELGVAALRNGWLPAG